MNNLYNFIKLSFQNEHNNKTITEIFEIIVKNINDIYKLEEKLNDIQFVEFLTITCAYANSIYFFINREKYDCNINPKLKSKCKTFLDLYYTMSFIGNKFDCKEN